MPPIDIDRRGHVTVLTVGHSFGTESHDRDTWSALKRAFDRAIADAAVAAIVLQSAGQNFSMNAQHVDVNRATSRISGLRRLLVAVEGAQKPVIAAMHGATSGVALELALAASHRLATPGTQFLFPDERPVDAEEALAIGLIDRIAETSSDAVAWAEELAGFQSGLPPTSSAVH